MESLNLSKKRIIIYSVVLILLAILFYVLGFNSFWGLFVVFPISLFVDVCYITLPFTLLTILSLSVYSHIKKDFEKFNTLYEILAFMITIGFIDICVENAITTSYGVYEFDFSKGFVYAGFLIIAISNIIFMARKKDTRLFVYSFLPLFLLYSVYSFINMVG